MIQFGDDITITDPPLGSGGGEYTRAINDIYICTESFKSPSLLTAISISTTQFFSPGSSRQTQPTKMPRRRPTELPLRAKTPRMTSCHAENENTTINMLILAIPPFKAPSYSPQPIQGTHNETPHPPPAPFPPPPLPPPRSPTPNPPVLLLLLPLLPTPPRLRHLEPRKAQRLRRCRFCSQDRLPTRRLRGRLREREGGGRGDHAGVGGRGGEEGGGVGDVEAVE